MKKRVAIIQSSYIPWKGYFDIINMVDDFILYDDVQFTKRDWRNRNIIKTPNGPQWLTIPVETKDKYYQLICEAKVVDGDWAKKHWKTIELNYHKARAFKFYRDRLAALYERAAEQTHLSQISRLFIDEICAMLGIKTSITWSWDYPGEGHKTDRLVAICLGAGADSYLSGPSARDYIEAEKFEQAGIQLRYMDYSGYAEYRQLHGPFDHHVTMLDLLLNEGEDARRYMKSFSATNRSDRQG